MADLSQASIDKLNATLERLAGGGGYSVPGTNTNGSPIGGSGILNVVGQTATNIVEFGKKVERFQASVTDLAQAVAPLGNLGGTLGKLTSSLATFAAGEAERLKAQYQTVSQVGGSGTGNMVATNQAIANTRMTTEEYTRTVIQNIKDLAGVGPTVADGMREFGDFMNSPSMKSVFSRMADLGFSIEQLNEVAVRAVNINKGANLSNAQTQATFRKMLEDMAMQLNANASAYGVSRQDQLKAGKEDLGRIDITAKTNQLLRSTNPEDKARAGDLGMATNITAAMGPTMRDAFMQSMTRAGGGIYGETAQAISQLAPKAFTEMQAIGRAMQTGNAQERAEAMRQMRDMPARIAAEAGRNGRENLLATNPAYAASAAGKLYGELSTYTTNIIGEVNRRPGITGERAGENLRNTSLLNQQGIITNPAQGTPGTFDRGSLTTTLINEVDTQIKNLGTNLATTLTMTNDKITALGKGIDALVYSQMLRDPDIFKKVISDVVEKASSAGATAEDKLKLLDIKKAIGVTRADTTFGATGSPFESKGNLLATINENPTGGTQEGVFSRTQIDNLVRTALIAGDSTKSTAPGLANIGKIATQISDAVSSALPSASATESTSNTAQDDVVSAIDGLNKSVMELVSLQKQNNKITESGLNKVAGANSVYG
jgi:hypothetical protein